MWRRGRESIIHTYPPDLLPARGRGNCAKERRAHILVAAQQSSLPCFTGEDCEHIHTHVKTCVHTHTHIHMSLIKNNKQGQIQNQSICVHTIHTSISMHVPKDMHTHTPKPTPTRSKATHVSRTSLGQRTQPQLLWYPDIVFLGDLNDRILTLVHGGL